VAKHLKIIYNMNIMEYTCDCCNYFTKKKYNYDKHILSNKHVLMESKSKVSLSKSKVSLSKSKVSPENPINVLDISDNKIISCKYCGQQYKHKQSVTKHIKYSCTKNKTEDLTELVRLLNLQLEYKDKQLEHKDKQLETQTKQIEKLIGKLEINYSQTNNIINNIVNVNLLKYDDTDVSHLTDTDYIKCVNKITNCVKAMIEKIHFDPEKPENMNMYIPSLKEKYIMMYKDNKWILTSNKELETVYGDKEYLIESWIDKKKDDKIVQKYSKYLKIKDKENELKNIYDEIKLMMYNNKDVVKHIKN